MPPQIIMSAQYCVSELTVRKSQQRRDLNPVTLLLVTSV